MEMALCMRSFEESIEKGTLQVRNILDEAVKRGITAIDILASCIGDHNEARSLGEYVSQQGCQVVSYSTRLTAISAADCNSTVFEAFEMEFSKALLLKSPYIGIRTNTGEEAIKDCEIMQRVIEGYKALIKLTRKYGVKIVVENTKGVSSRPENIIAIVSKFPEDIYACLDTGNFAPSHRYTSNRQLISVAAHCHFKTLAFDKDGLESTIDTRECIQQLIDAGYSGYVAVEYEGGGDESQGVDNSVALLRRLLHEESNQV